MVTKEQAQTARSFHYTGRKDCERTVGPRGGVTVTVDRLQATGQCKTWVTRPTEFCLPVKYGLYDSHNITQDTAHQFHVVAECPAGIW